MENIKRMWDKFSECDWTQSPQIFIFTIIYLISRIPFLNLGFGVDADAWRIANSAFDLNNLLIYNTSRFPGYPLPEYVNSLLINYGWVATNSLTMIISLIAILMFAKILKELDIENKGLIIITFAFMPLIWINSVNTMDYMWSVAFIMLSWYFIIKNHHPLAGLMMGLAIASRPTSALLLIPFLYLLFTESKIKKGLYFLIASSLTAATLFLPLILQNGLDFVTFYPGPVQWNLVIMELTYFIGLLALIFWVILMIISCKNTYNVLKEDKNTIFALLAIILICLFFLICPYEEAYLIPAIPFALFFISKISNRWLFTILCALLILNSFVSISTPSDMIEEGVTFNDAIVHIERTKTTQKIIHMPLNDSIIITGNSYPIIRYFRVLSDKSQISPEDNDPKIIIHSDWDTKSNRGYVYMADADEIIKWQNKGYRIYYMGTSAWKTTKINYGYDLNTLNCSNILDSVE